ncbi:hypothetical protein JCM8097_003148 [Rhodosporidiobolus ruineniae]
MKTAAAFVALSGLASSAFAATVNPNNLPHTSEAGQYGYNDCAKYGDSTTANCQTLYLESLDDFCLYAPPKKGTVGDMEREVVSWCTKAGHGARLIPKGTITGAHMIRTPNYIQITGTIKGTNINIPAGDDGGELDPHGADGNGNPVGAVVLSTINGQLTQIKEWNSFISDDEFCIRACYNGPDAWKWCNHIYDVMGCYWNDPGNYDAGSFDTCKADNVAMPMGEYKLANGKTSTWHQGVNPTPTGQAPAKSSQCTKQATIAAASYTTQRVTTSVRPTTTTKAATTKTTTTKASVPTSGSGKSCSADSDCPASGVPANGHAKCLRKQCSFLCNRSSGWTESADGNSCVKAGSAATTTSKAPAASSGSGGSCKADTDCPSAGVPAHGHAKCLKNKCTFLCNRTSGYVQQGNTCVKA